MFMYVLFKKLVEDSDSGIKVLNVIEIVQSAMKDSLGNSKDINTKLQGIDSNRKKSVVYREYLVELLGYSDDQLVELDNYIKSYKHSLVGFLELLLDKLKKEDRSLVIEALYKDLELMYYLRGKKGK